MLSFLVLARKQMGSKATHEEGVHPQWPPRFLASACSAFHLHLLPGGGLKLEDMYYHTTSIQRANSEALLAPNGNFGRTLTYSLQAGCLLRRRGREVTSTPAFCSSTLVRTEDILVEGRPHAQLSTSHLSSGVT